MSPNEVMPLTKLNVGCGKDIMPPPWANLDAEPLEGVTHVFDLNHIRPDILTERLPFLDDTFDEILMSHILEHLPRPLDVMQELHRVAQPGALLTVRVPYGSSDAAYEDPQHCRQYFLQSFEYFGQPCYWRADYGYRGDWQTKSRTLIMDTTEQMVAQSGQNLDELMSLVKHARNVVAELYVELTCVKPIRAQQRELAEATPIQFSFQEMKPAQAVLSEVDPIKTTE